MSEVYLFVGGPLDGQRRAMSDPYSMSDVYKVAVSNRQIVPYDVIKPSEMTTKTATYTRVSILGITVYVYDDYRSWDKHYDKHPAQKMLLRLIDGYRVPNQECY